MSTIDAQRPYPPALIAGAPPRILLVRAPYYRAVVEGLGTGAAAILREAAAPFDTIDVAGAYELPQAIALVVAADRHRYAGFVALGCVIRGETDHYDFICEAAMQGLMRVALDHGLALGVGLLTVDTLAQAQARSGAEHNKGAEAAVACLTQVNVARFHLAPARAG